MGYTILADLIVILHAMFVLFVLFGGFLIVKWPQAKWLHLPVMAWGVMIEFTGWICPLTPLESWLRQQAGNTGNEADFLQRFLSALLYPDDLTRAMQIAFGTIVVALNLVVYGWLWQRRETAAVNRQPSSDRNKEA